jgi:amino acid permease
VTWEGLLTIFNVGLQDGGPAGLVYGFLFCWAGYTAVVASLAELTSRFPTAGGQYHWTYELAPPKYRNFISWITGQYLPLSFFAQHIEVQTNDLSQAGKLCAHGRLIWLPFSTLAAPSSKA